MHDFVCEGCGIDIATLKYNNKRLCFECLQHELGLEISTETTFNYEGICLGTDENIEEVYKNLNQIGINVKEIGEE